MLCVGYGLLAIVYWIDLFIVAVVVVVAAAAVFLVVIMSDVGSYETIPNHYCFCYLFTFAPCSHLLLAT